MDINQVHSFILAGGKGKRLLPLTETICKPAVSFGGDYKLIDFTLSNCINSGFLNISVLTQYKHDSLELYIHRLKNKLNDINLRCNINTIKSTSNIQYEGTADAVRQCLHTISEQNCKYVMILSSDHVYKMDYLKMLKAHIRNHSEVSIGAIESDLTSAVSFGVIEADNKDRIIGFEEKPEIPKPIVGKCDTAYISMGIYIFNTKTLIDALEGSDHDFGSHIIPKLIKDRRVFAYNFINESKELSNYWQDVGTIDSYYDTNFRLAYKQSDLRLEDSQWPLYTANNIVSDRNINSAASFPKIEHSICSSGISVDRSARIKDSIILDGVHIGEGVEIQKAIIDHGVRIPMGTRIGFNPEEDRIKFTLSPHGVVVVGSRSIF